MGTTTLTTLTGGLPSLQTIADLVRVHLNDWQPGALSTPGEGKITTDNPIKSPQTLTALSSSIRELYRELRNVGEPRLIRDNVQANLPANSVTGPNIQTYLSSAGYWDGGVLNPSPTLPSDMMKPLRLWEQQTTNLTSLPFVPMKEPQFGLPSRNQTFALGEWEWREGNLWFVGTLAPVTIRMRYLAALTQFFPPQIFVTAVSVSGSTVTFTAANTLTAGQSVYLSGFVSNTALNGLTVTVLSASATQFTATITGTPNTTDLGVALPVVNYSLVFASTFIPIMDCEEAVSYKTAAKIIKALSGMTPQATDLSASAGEAMFQLKNAIARRGQTVEYNREPYTGDDQRSHDRNLM